MKKLLLFTFDYELFLGNRSGKVQECIIGPTDKLLSLLNRFHYKGVFFVDTVYLLKLKEIATAHENAQKDLDAIYKQLQTIVEQGHYIFPHIHPHWLDAVYDPQTNEWSLRELRYYQFSALPPEQQTRLFDESVQLIQSIATSVNPSYVIDSYRAGGWSIQPFECFKPHFLKHGIYHEWSVLPGKYLFSNAHGFDFRLVPQHVSTYRFNNDICAKDNDGPFIAWTISTLLLSPFETWFNFKVSGMIQRLLGKVKRKGTTVSSAIKEEGDVYRGEKMLRLTASFEGLNPFTLIKYLALIKKSSYFHFISHPKLITRVEFYMIRLLFASLARRKKGLETDFRKVTV